MYQSLYRAFRPTTLDGLVCQEHIVRILRNQIETGRVGHAYLFCGPRGTGKTSTAKIFARAINCENPQGGSPCGKCAACKALADPSNLDITEIDAASNNGVNEMRDLREKVQYPPVAGKYKVYIVDEVHMLSDSAFNALLKTLEEPPAHAVFILATTEPHKLPATILSRCMRFDFRLIPQADIEAHLKQVFSAVGKEFEEEAVAAIARAGAGSMRDSLSVADICLSYSKGKLTYTDVCEVLGSADFAEIAKLGEYILTDDASSALTEAERIIASGKGAGVLAKDILVFLNRCTVAANCRDGNAVLSLPEELYAEVHRIAARADARKLLRACEIFAQVETDLRYSSAPRIVLETAIVKACLPAADLDLLTLAKRLDMLEAKLSAGVYTAAQPSPASSYLEREGRAPRAEREEEPFFAAPSAPLPDAAPRRQAAQAVDASLPENRKLAFAHFLRALRRGAKNGVLFTMCQDLGSFFEGDTMVLVTDSDTIFRRLQAPDNAKAVQAALESIGIRAYDVRMRGARVDPVQQGIEALKKNFPAAPFEVK